MSGLVRAVESAQLADNRRVVAGWIIPADHPLAVAMPALFESLDATMQRDTRQADANTPPGMETPKRRKR